jgi:DNA-binding response OmpR family regulator
MDNLLAGRRVLVVEDEFFLAADLEDSLTRAGAEVVGPIPDLRAALAQVQMDSIDLVVLDINLRGDEKAYPIADVLSERGIPFLFTSGYASRDLPKRYRNIRRLEKPFEMKSLVKAVSELARLAADSGSRCSSRDVPGKPAG